MQRLILTLLTAVLTTSPIMATAFDQLPPGKWWENERLVERIHLTDEQQGQIHDLVYEHALRMIDLNAAVKKSELELSGTVEGDEFDPATVRKAFGSFQGNRQKLETERFEMLLSVRQILDAAQWAELQRLRREFERRKPDRMGERPGQRPGGPGGPGGQRPGGQRPGSSGR